MFFSLGAATRAALLGERYLHGAILHQFSHQTDASLRLTARARQFSSFVLLVGKIASADTFEPTHATIVQNKDTDSRRQTVVLFARKKKKRKC
jgi:hypothetical protein